MAVYYADASVLVKRHANEIGSAWVRSLCTPAAQNTIIMSRISTVEVISALHRKYRDSAITAADYQLFAADFRAVSAAQYQIVEVGLSVYSLACQLVETRHLRAYDAMQLAAAVLSDRTLRASSLPALTFLAGDRQLSSAALAEGLAVDTPLAHP